MVKAAQEASSKHWSKRSHFILAQFHDEYYATITLLPELATVRVIVKGK